MRFSPFSALAKGGDAGRMAAQSAPGGASLAEEWSVARAVEFIASGDYESAILQFPDELLRESVAVARAVEAGCRARGCATRVYVGADSTFSPLGVDEIAAEHVPRSCVVHYGRASLRATSRVPALFVLPRGAMDVEGVARAVACSEAAKERVDEARRPGGEAEAEGADEGAESPSSPDGAPVLCPAEETPRPHVVVFLDQPLLEHAPVFEAALERALREAHGPGALPRVVLARPSRLQSVPGAIKAGGFGKEADAGAEGGTEEGRGAAPEGGAEEGRGAAPEGAKRASPREPASPDEPFSSLPPATRLEGCAGYVWLSPAREGRGDAAGGSEDGASDSEDDAPSSSGDPGLPSSSLFFLGPETAPALRELLWSFSTADWTVCDLGTAGSVPGAGAGAGAGSGPVSDSTLPVGSACSLTRGIPRSTQMALRRRYAATQRLRDASVVGLLVGTLSVQGFGEALRSLRSLCVEAGKKPYTLAMGRPNPAKLANFPEIEAFVFVGDGADAVLESHDYLAPVLTPFEARLALDPDGPLWTVEGYRMGLEGILGVDLGKTDRGGEEGEEAARGEGREVGEEAARGEGGEGGGVPSRAASASSNALVVQQARQALAAPGTLSGGPAPGALTSSVIARGHANAAEYLHARRTWRGVEAPGGEPEEARPAGQGRVGRAAAYADERDV